MFAVLILIVRYSNGLSEVAFYVVIRFLIIVINTVIVVIIVKVLVAARSFLAIFEVFRIFLILI